MYISLVRKGLLIEQDGLVSICPGLTTSVPYNIVMSIACPHLYLSAAALVQMPPDTTR